MNAPKYPLIALVTPLLGSLLGACRLSPDETGRQEGAYLALFERGKDQLRDEKYAEARATFQELVKRYPSHPSNDEVHLFLSDCEYILGQEQQAQTIREGVARTGRTPELRTQALSGQGMREFGAERYGQAAERFQSAAEIEKDPQKKALLLFRKGIALQRAGRFDEGRQAYRQATALAPGSRVQKLCETQLAYPDHFFVQTGAFREEANAHRQKELLVEKGFAAQVAPVESQGRTLHLVRVGRFPDRASASALRERLLASRLLPDAAKISVKP